MRFTSLHYAKINVLSSDLADPAPNNTRTCQLLTQPWKIPAVCGWIMGKWGKERCFWSEGIKLQRNRCQCWALRVPAVRANMCENTCSVHVTACNTWARFTALIKISVWHFVYNCRVCTKSHGRLALPGRSVWGLYWMSWLWFSLCGLLSVGVQKKRKR